MTLAGDTFPPRANAQSCTYGAQEALGEGVDLEAALDWQWLLAG